MQAPCRRSPQRHGLRPFSPGCHIVSDELHRRRTSQQANLNALPQVMRLETTRKLLLFLLLTLPVAHTTNTQQEADNKTFAKLFPDCHAIKRADHSATDGVYNISTGSGNISVWCNMTGLDGTGWTLIAVRQHGLAPIQATGVVKNTSMGHVLPDAHWQAMKGASRSSRLQCLCRLSSFGHSRCMPHDHKCNREVLYL